MDRGEARARLCQKRQPKYQKNPTLQICRKQIHSGACDLSGAEDFHLDSIRADAKVEQLLLHRAHESPWAADEVFGLWAVQMEIASAVQSRKLHAAGVLIVYVLDVLLGVRGANES